MSAAKKTWRPSVKTLARSGDLARTGVSAEKKLGDLRSKALAGEDNVLHRWRPSVKTLARSGDLARTGPRKNRATIPVWNGEIFAQVPVMLK